MKLKYLGNWEKGNEQKLSLLLGLHPTYFTQFLKTIFIHILLLVHYYH